MKTGRQKSLIVEFVLRITTSKMHNILSNYEIGKFSQSKYPKCKAEIALIQ